FFLYADSTTILFYTLSLHDALPIFLYGVLYSLWVAINGALYTTVAYLLSISIKNRFVALTIPFLWWFIMNFITGILGIEAFSPVDRKSTRLNSSHVSISYAVFCLKK